MPDGVVMEGQCGETWIRVCGEKANVVSGDKCKGGKQMWGKQWDWTKQRIGTEKYKDGGSGGERRGTWWWESWGEKNNNIPVGPNALLSIPFKPCINIPQYYIDQRKPIQNQLHRRTRQCSRRKINANKRKPLNPNENRILIPLYLQNPRTPEIRSQHIYSTTFSSFLVFFCITDWEDWSTDHRWICQSEQMFLVPMFRHNQKIKLRTQQSQHLNELAIGQWVDIQIPHTQDWHDFANIVRWFQRLDVVGVADGCLGIFLE